MQDVQEWVIGGDDKLENYILSDEEIVQADINERQEEEEIVDEEEEDNKFKKALQLAVYHIEY